jgi:hypothetical protein
VSRLRLGVAAAAVLAVTFLTAVPAFAHEIRPVGNPKGTYVMTVGWLSEPAYVGISNSVELLVHDAKGNAVDDLGPNGLKVQVIFGSQTSDPLTLNLSFDPDTKLGMHGQYLASIIPTSPGNYTFHFTGDINGQTIDEKFTSSPSTFNPVVDPASVQFPVKNPTLTELSTGISRLGPRVDAAQARGAQAQNVAKTAKDSASTAKTTGIVGVVVAVIALALGLVAVLRARRTT